VLSTAGDVTVTAKREKCRDDVIFKNVHLLDNKLKLAQYHVMTGTGRYVIVLQDKRVIVQTLQLDTQPSMSLSARLCVTCSHWRPQSILKL